MIPGRRILFLTACLSGLTCVALSPAHAKWGSAPPGWGDFRFALADDNTKTDIIDKALQAGTMIYGHYRYLNNGVDTNSNWYSYSGPGGGTLLNFQAAGDNLVINSSYVIYMLQEDGNYGVFRTNVQSPAFMKAFFWNLQWVCKTLKGRHAVLIIEPDTWGYLLQYEREKLSVAKSSDYGKTIAGESAHVNDLGYAHLAGLPNTVAGLAQGIIKTVRTFAPDATVGFHVNTWAWYPAVGGDVRGVVYWPQDIVDTSAAINAAFIKNLFGGTAAPGGAETDRGDFIVVEKYGLDAGYVRSLDASSLGARYFWDDTQMAKWVKWSARIGTLLDLPVLGWQIPIGNMGLPNETNRWQDTFMPYFFAHPKDFINAGFIGLWVGKGLNMGTDYSNTKGQGDDGYLFENMRAFDKGRPWLGPTAIRVGPGGASRENSGDGRGRVPVRLGALPRFPWAGFDFDALGRVPQARPPLK